MSRAIRVLCCAAILAQAPLRAQAQDAADALAPAEIEALRQRGLPSLRKAEAPQAPATGAAQQVDLEAAHQRALAMYAEGALFHAPLPAPGMEQPAARARLPVADPAPRGARPAATPWSLLAGLAVTVLLIAWFLLRVRPALMPPAEAAPEAKAFSWKPKRRPRPMKPVWPVQPPAPLPRQAPSNPGSTRLARDPRRR